MIQPPIVNYYTKINFDDMNKGVKAEPRQEVLLEASVREIHIDMLKYVQLGFP